jgi:hypothetical protein
MGKGPWRIKTRTGQSGQAGTPDKSGRFEVNHRGHEETLETSAGGGKGVQAARAGRRGGRNTRVGGDVVLAHFSTSLLWF